MIRLVRLSIDRPKAALPAWGRSCARDHEPLEMQQVS